MIIFQIIQKLLEVLGVDISRKGKINLIKLKVAAFFLSEMVFFFTSATYLIFKADSPQEYGKQLNITNMLTKIHAKQFLNQMSNDSKYYL